MDVEKDSTKDNVNQKASKARNMNGYQYFWYVASRSLCKLDNLTGWLSTAEHTLWR